MSPSDPNLERIELVAAALGPLRDQLVFVGGCAAGLLISDPAAAPIRATLDVLLASHDLEDILNVIAGRTELIDEIAGAPANLRNYLGDQCRTLMATPDFENYLPGLIQDDSYGEQSDFVLERMRLIMGIGSIGAGS